MSDSPILEVRDLKMHFPVKEGIFLRTNKFNRAVDGVSLSIQPGETLGLVGESGWEVYPWPLHHPPLPAYCWFDFF